MGYQDDAEFEDLTITAVESYSDGGWSIRLSSGWSFGVPADSPVAPAEGMSARLYGRGLGFPVRGLFLDGREVYYRTEAEAKAERLREVERRNQERRYDAEKDRDETGRRVAALPAALRARLARFRANNPDFWWEYEGYELAACEAAASIAAALRVEGASGAFYDGAMAMFREMTWDEQVARVPSIVGAGLSGNQFGCACHLAHHLLCGRDDVAEWSHGAMCPLAGCRDYGCVPRDAGAAR